MLFRPALFSLAVVTFWQMRLPFSSSLSLRPSAVRTRPRPFVPPIFGRNGWIGHGLASSFPSAGHCESGHIHAPVLRSGGGSLHLSSPVSGGGGVEIELDEIASALATLNGGQPVNPNSPAQVSAVLFGPPDPTRSGPRPVTREVLSALVEGGGGSGRVEDDVGGPAATRRMEVARLVLRHRELKSLLRGGVRLADTAASRPSQLLQHNAVLSTLAQPSDTLAGGGCSDSSEEGAATASILSSRGADRSPYGRLVDSLFVSAASQRSLLDPYWHDALDRIVRPSARAMAAQLDPRQCPMGFDPTANPSQSGATLVSTSQGKKGSLLAYVREQKRKFPDCVILTRVGDFYESFGVDAILLVEHCGLNPMAGKARAGCPIKNVQPTLDCLTRAGFRVAVYEEASDTDASAGGAASAGAKSRLKNRMLAQIVSSAVPTYLYDLILGNGDTLVTSPMARPHVGIVSNASGYTIVEISSEERTVKVSERNTAEAVACRLAAYPPADPLFYVPSPGEEATSSPVSSKLEHLPFLPSRSDPANDGPGSRYRVKVLPSVVLEDPAPGMSDVDRARKCIVSALLKISEFNEYTENGPSSKPSQRSITYEDFALVEMQDIASQSRTCTNPLYVETATQLGLMSNPTIPPLVSYLLPDSAPASSRRFLRRWLLTPPPPHIADAMASLVGSLKEGGTALPPLSVPPLGKVLSLIRAGQASAQVYREILSAIDATVAILDAHPGREEPDGLIQDLIVVLQHESGIAAEPESVKSRCLDATEAIEEVVSAHQLDQYQHRRSFSVDQVSNCGQIIPFAYFERNEGTWRGQIKPSAAEEAYKKVKDATGQLAEAVAIEFWGLQGFIGTNTDMGSAKESKSPIVQDIFNNIFALKSIPSWADNDEDYYHPRDRNGKLLRSRYTTARVDKALHEYIIACERASAAVTSVLSDLAEALCDDGHLPAIVQASHTNLIISTAAHHAAHAKRLGWSLAKITDAGNDAKSSAGHFNSVWPYWMDRSESVANTFALDGLFLLTAPNMSGKSTLMRSTAAAALLTSCGLCAPLDPGSYVKRFDNIFVRGASADIPTESKSAFGAEMGDIAALLRACGEGSLVFVDELGRGTSPKDGVSHAVPSIRFSCLFLNVPGINQTTLTTLFVGFTRNSLDKSRRCSIGNDGKRRNEWIFRNTFA